MRVLVWFGFVWGLWAQPFPGTTALERGGDLSLAMLDGIDRYLDRAAVGRKAAGPERMRELIGVVDARVPFTELRAGGWPVLAGLDAEGVVRQPAGRPTRCWIAMEEVKSPGVGELVFQPALLGLEPVGKGRHARREHLYRMAYPLGRHVLGFEVQMVLAAVDYCVARGLPVRVSGQGEGAVVALYSTYVDDRIEEGRVGPLPDAGPLWRNIWKGAGEIESTRVKRVGVAPESGLTASETHFQQMVEFCQKLLRQAERRRGEWWAKADLTTPAAWAKSKAPYLVHYVNEGIGAIALDGRGKVESRQIYDAVDYTGWEVTVPVAGEVFGYGILLVPKGMKPGERRPLVVAQHGLEGRPQDLIQPADAKAAQVYGRFAARLVERGFIVYAPQNPYVHGDRFRRLQRKANPLGLTLYSFIVAQHKATLDWLEKLPIVDGDRIGFYGLSYGGRTAMLVPPVEPRYKVVICSGNFNEWTWKIASNEAPYSYLFTQEYEMFDFNQGNTFGHYELAVLMAPRAFMVERGHADGVGIDEWVSYEYAKVRRLYANWGLGEKTTIEYFPGPHQIWGVGTFAFLHQQLRWP
jgi:dienelactone hydrolase